MIWGRCRARFWYPLWVGRIKKKLKRESSGATHVHRYLGLVSPLGVQQVDLHSALLVVSFWAGRLFSQTEVRYSGLPQVVLFVFSGAGAPIRWLQPVYV